MTESVDMPDMKEDMGGAERRLHLKAFDYWRTLKGDTDHPLFRDLTVSGLAPFKDQSLLVERVSVGGDGAPLSESKITVRYFGPGLAPLFNRRPTVGDNFRDYTDSGFARELLSLLDNRSATDRAAEFEYVDLEIDSRGVMMPLSREGGSVDFLWVVISSRSYQTDLGEGDAPEQDTSAKMGVDQAPSGGADGEAPASPDVTPADAAAPDSAAAAASDTADPATAIARAASEQALEPDVSATDFAPSPTQSTAFGSDLAARLAHARDEASQHRGTNAPGFDRLYGLLAEALGLYEASLDNPAMLEDRLAEEGLKTQARAPFTPILKLIFGKDYDKTRLTEYGAAMAFAVREGVSADGLAVFLSDMPGGIKGCVRAERAARRGDKTTTAHSRLKAAKRKLRDASGVTLEDIKLSGEFDLVLVRRNAEAAPTVLGRADVSESTLSALIERQARRHRRPRKG